MEYASSVVDLSCRTDFVNGGNTNILVCGIGIYKSVSVVSGTAKVDTFIGMDGRPVLWGHSTAAGGNDVGSM